MSGLRSRLAAVACVVFCALAGCDSRQELTRVDSEKEANRILVEIEARGVSNAAKEEKSAQRKTAWSIVVPADQLSLARTILVQCDLPRDTHSGFSDLATSGSLIPTKGEERAKLIYATSGELARTFETYDRVVSARVHIVVPEQDSFSHEAATKPAATSAMVLIKYTPLTPTTESRPRPAGAGFADAPVTAEDVKQMVARSVEGLSVDNVYVTFTRATVTPPTPPPVIAAATNSEPKTDSASPNPDKNLLMQLYGATALFGLIAIILTALLVREKRRQRLARA
jgi:type III secretion protein J